MSGGWIGIDLDGTLAHYESWPADGSVGAPVPKMVARVKRWLADGKDVRIVTARVAVDPGAPLETFQRQLQDSEWQRGLIEAWCLKHLGVALPVGCVKDRNMIELWDDRCVQVIPNTGQRVDGCQD